MSAVYPNAYFRGTNPYIDLVSVLDNTTVAPTAEVYTILISCLFVALGLNVYETCNHTFTGTAVSVQKLLEYPFTQSWNALDMYTSKAIHSSLLCILQIAPFTLSRKRRTVTTVRPLVKLTVDSSASMYLWPVVVEVFEKRRKPLPLYPSDVT